jgi:DNA mismatch repair protein MutS
MKRIEYIVKFIGNIDVIICKSYLAKTYHYCRPEIMVEREKSCVNAIALRHVLIEQLLQNEIYVPNDISLGIDIDGILLYGTNAVGKTSFIRSLGIAIIMAQSGMYVPCSKFQYKPYHAMYYRILGNDNLFKGLSTFAVEMSELRVILKQSNENSLKIIYI